MSNFENTVISSHLELIDAVNRSIRSTGFIDNYQAISDIVNQINHAELYKSVSKIVEVAQITNSSIYTTLSQLSEIVAKQSSFVEQVANLQNSYIQMFQSSYYYQIQDTLQSISGIITSQNLVINQTLLNISSVIDEISLEDIQTIKENVEDQDTYESSSIDVRKYIYDHVDESIKSNDVTELSNIFDNEMTEHMTHDHATSDDSNQSENNDNQLVASSIDFFAAEIRSAILVLVVRGIFQDLSDEGFIILLLLIQSSLITLRNLKK